jgi:hypothetical protein
MSSRLSHYAQIAPFTHYIVQAGAAGYMLASLTLNDTVSLPAGTILADMGKSVIINDYVYRKVQRVTVGDAVSYGNQVGYICLTSDLAPLFGSNRQRIAKLN